MKRKETKSYIRKKHGKNYKYGRLFLLFYIRLNLTNYIHLLHQEHLALSYYLLVYLSPLLVPTINNNTQKHITS